MSIPGKLVLASSDLNARARVLEAAGEREIVFTGPTGFSDAAAGAGLLILDLDEGGTAALEELVELGETGSLKGEVIGFMSHVDRELGRSAREAGCRPIARGRFWAHLAETLGPSAP